MIDALLVMSLCLVVGCSGPEMLDNPRFADWCGELPCGYRIDKGAVQRVPTWHRHDYGAELMGMDSQISQRVDTNLPVGCVRIDLNAMSEEGAGLELALDFEDDGKIEHSEAIPASDFEVHTFKLQPPTGYTSLRYILAKRGPSRAVVGKLSAIADSECYGERIRLDAGSACSADESCKSLRCFDGYCSSCAAGSCSEGDACAADSDCMDGACAGGVCRACAKNASCPARTSCTNGSQCARGSCVAGPLPSLSARPEQDGVCAECSGDADCPSGRCTLGFCGACATDMDCTGGLVCRYGDSYDASGRACLPPLTTKLTRGQLCESTSDCELGLSCNATAGRAKRCGVACSIDGDCSAGICSRPGTRRLPGSTERIKLPSFGQNVSERIATCFPRVSLDGRCSVHDQCSGSLGSSCCTGMCSALPVDRSTGQCGAPVGP